MNLSLRFFIGYICVNQYCEIKMTIRQAFIKELLAILFALAFNFLSVAQEFVQLEGVVLDAETNLPLQYTNIDLANNQIGTISNKNGEFRLKLPAELVGKKIVFSYLGYQSFVIPVENCQGKYLKIKLSVLPISISTINVTYYNPQQIIYKALQLVSKNYLNRAANLQAFYREEVLENNECVQFIEAVMEIYKGTYNDKKDKDRIGF